MEKVAYSGVSVFWVLAAASTAAACPFCQSEIGEQVNAGVFNQDFAKNVLLVLLPFPVLLLVVTLIHTGVPWSRRPLPSVRRQFTLAPKPARPGREN